MRQAFIFWWGLRTAREQRMLLATGAALAIVVAWLLIVRPMDDALAAARARHARAVLDLARARGAADRIARLEHDGPPPPAAPLATVIGRKASEAGFAAARVTPDGRRVAVAIEAARAQALFGWLAGLERHDGIVVDRLSARANGDATIAVDATLRTQAR